MAPPAVGPDEMLAVAWFGKVSLELPFAAKIAPYVGSCLDANTINPLQEKVEVIRAKKPHIVESVSVIPFFKCLKLWQTMISIIEAVEFQRMEILTALRGYKNCLDALLCGKQ